MSRSAPKMMTTTSMLRMVVMEATMALTTSSNPTRKKRTAAKRKRRKRNQRQTVCNLRRLPTPQLRSSRCPSKANPRSSLAGSSFLRTLPSLGHQVLPLLCLS